MTKLLWQVALPEPFILDDEISDQKFIAEMLASDSTEEVAAVMVAMMQKSKNSFVFYATKEEVDEMFSGYQLLKEDNYYVIVIKNKKGKVIGKGEIIHLGERVSQNVVLKEFESHMKGFEEKFDAGNKHLDDLVAQLEMIKKQVAMAKPLTTSALKN